MEQAADRRHRASRGFTLLELLVATAVFAIVAALLLSAIRSFVSVQARIDDRLLSDDEMKSGYQFLSLVMSRISPRSAGPSAGGAPTSLAFRGGDVELEWIGIMPARYGAGGLYRFHLFLQPASGSERSALVLQFSPMTNRDLPLQSGPLEARVMARDVARVTFRYLDSESVGLDWEPAWHHNDRLPARIGLSVQFGEQQWPEIVVAVIPTGDSAVTGRVGGGSGPVIGPY